MTEGSNKSEGIFLGSNRRGALRATLGLAVAAPAMLIAARAVQGAEFAAGTEGKCATCRYWGGKRRIGQGGGTVSADGTGWCNNPASPAYQKETRPDQGAPVWTRWEALDG